MLPINGQNSLVARLPQYNPIAHPVRNPMPYPGGNMPGVWGAQPPMGYQPPMAPVNPSPMPIQSPYLPVQGTMMPMQNPQPFMGYQPQPNSLQNQMRYPVSGVNSLARL